MFPKQTLHNQQQLLRFLFLQLVEQNFRRVLVDDVYKTIVCGKYGTYDGKWVNL